MTDEQKTTENLYLEVYFVQDDDVTASLETVIVLFVLKYLQTSEIDVQFVLCRQPPDTTVFRFNMTVLNKLKCCVSKRDETPSQVTSCVLPAIRTRSRDMYVAGLCAVLRRILKQVKLQVPNRLCEQLLGFRSGCLMACAEVSVWTKFCEVDLPTAIKSLFNCPADEQSCTRLVLPPEVLKFEAHLREPVRTHNIAKRRQDLAKSNASPANETENEQKSNRCKPSRTLRKAGATSTTSTCNLELAGEDAAGKPGRRDRQRTRSTNVNAIERGGDNLPTWLHVHNEFPAFDNRRKTEDWSVEQLTDHVSQLCNAAAPDNVKLNAVVEEEALPQLCHLYAEGTDRTLADMVLLPCIHFTIGVFWKKLDLIKRHIPLVLQWYSRIVVDTRVAAALKDFSVAAHCNDGRASHFSHVISEMAVFNGTSQSADSNHINPSPWGNLPACENDSNEIEIPEVDSKSLYIRDPKRYRSQARLFTKQDDVDHVFSVVKNAGIRVAYSDHPCESVALDWTALPDVVHPSYGELPSSRIQRKCQQVENLVMVILKLAKQGDVIVDFCSGGGHLGIVLAYLLPRCRVVMVDNKEESLGRAQQRVEALRLTNATLYQGNLDYFVGDFDVGTSLHACGVATDLVLQRCIQQQAVFVACPCCYGAVQNTHLITYPRSTVFRQLGLSYNDYFVLGHAADQTHVNNPKLEQGTSAMGLIDTDRLLQASEEGYSSILCTLIPESCTPKHNLLIGLPASKRSLV